MCEVGLLGEIMVLKPVSILCCSSSELLTKCCNVYKKYITTFCAVMQFVRGMQFCATFNMCVLHVYDLIMALVVSSSQISAMLCK